jgi:hypothetical protein
MKDDPDDVTLTDVARRVDRDVPILSKSAFGIERWPHNTIEGNFALGGRVTALAEPTSDAIPKRRPTS